MDILGKLKDIFGDSEVLENQPLSAHCTYRIGGAAKYFVYAKSVVDLQTCTSLLTLQGIKYHILGRGANTLFSSNGFNGVVICTLKMNKIATTGNYVYCQCGVTSGKLSRELIDNSLTGGEFLAGIPSSIGGLVKMNAGAYGGEIADIIESVWVLRGGKVLNIPREQLHFGYRKCLSIGRQDIILAALFKFQKGNKEVVKQTVSSLISRRALSQPLEFPSCGSVFKRPKGAYAAALIEQMGLKGYTVGGAQVSDKHSGFIVNFNDAKSQDVLNMIDYIKKEVYNIYGIKLETEVVIVD